MNKFERRIGKAEVVEKNNKLNSEMEEKEKELTKHMPKSALVFLPPVKSIVDA